MGELISRDMAIVSHGHAALPLPSHVYIRTSSGNRVQYGNEFQGLITYVT